MPMGTEELGMIKNYEGITELTPRIVNALIDRIEISEKRRWGVEIKRKYRALECSKKELKIAQFSKL